MLASGVGFVCPYADRACAAFLRYEINGRYDVAASAALVIRWPVLRPITRACALTTIQANAVDLAACPAYHTVAAIAQRMHFVRAALALDGLGVLDLLAHLASPL